MSLDFLEEVERQLVEATERGVSRRRWRWPWLMRLRLPWRAPTVGIAAGVVAALAASAIAATLTLPASHHDHARVAADADRAHSFTTAGSVPSGFQPQSFTAISEFTWWLLGQAPCDGQACLTIVRTEDGGRSFVRVPAPPTSTVGNVRFADAEDGYLFGPGLWTTHDAGQSWTQLHLGAVVDDLAAADGYVYALVSTRGPYKLMRSPVGHDRWRVVAGAGDGPLSGLWVQGHTVIVSDGDRVRVSADQGRTFTAGGGVPGEDCKFDATADADVIWGLCMTGMAPDEVIRSVDSGSSFSATAAVPDGPLQAFAAASGSSAVVAAQGLLSGTTDGGATWTRVDAPSAGWTYLGFTDSTHGVALGAFGTGGHQQWRLYYTTDAGASYHYVPIGSP